MIKRKQLIIHADDLGICESVNRSIFYLLKKRRISSASAIAVGSHFDSVAEFATLYPKMDLGVHLTFISDSKKLRYRPLSHPSLISSLIDKDGFFLSDKTKLSKKAKFDHVVHECNLQILKAINAGLKPTHLDGHRDCFSMRKDLARALTLIAKTYELPYRPVGAPRHIFSISKSRSYEVTLQTYLGFLDEMTEGFSELIVHPGLDKQDLRTLIGKTKPWGALWRQHDNDILRSTSFQRGLKHHRIRLVGWRHAKSTASSIA